MFGDRSLREETSVLVGRLKLITDLSYITVYLTSVTKDNRRSCPVSTMVNFIRNITTDQI